MQVTLLVLKLFFTSENTQREHNYILLDLRSTSTNNGMEQREVKLLSIWCYYFIMGWIFQKLVISRLLLINSYKIIAEVKNTSLHRQMFNSISKFNSVGRSFQSRFSLKSSHSESPWTLASWQHPFPQLQRQTQHACYLASWSSQLWWRIDYHLNEAQHWP